MILCLLTYVLRMFTFNVYTVFVYDIPFDYPFTYLVILSYELPEYAYLIPHWSYHEHDKKDS